MVADYAVSGSTLTLAHTYLWGTDLSGNLHGASGVGGLLAFGTASGLIELPVFDGNGNVMGLTDRTSGQVTAAYEYSPFGDTLRKVGTYASINPVRFSSKYTDDETKLIYYGKRYYSSALGRFLGRDPIGEKGASTSSHSQGIHRSIGMTLGGWMGRAHKRILVNTEHLIRALIRKTRLNS